MLIFMTNFPTARTVTFQLWLDQQLAIQQSLKQLGKQRWTNSFGIFGKVCIIRQRMQRLSLVVKQKSFTDGLEKASC